MLDSDYKMPVPPIDLQQALSDVVESVAMENASLSKILSSASKILEKSHKNSENILEFAQLSDSVNMLAKCVLRLQLVIQSELEDAKSLIQEFDELIDEEELEE